MSGPRSRARITRITNATVWLAAFPATDHKAPAVAIVAADRIMRGFCWASLARSEESSALN